MKKLIGTSIALLISFVFAEQLLAYQYQWDRISIPYNIANPAVAVYQENVYLVGGRTEMSHWSPCSNQIWKFDPKVSTWQEMGGQLPYGMYTRGKVVVAGDKLIISPCEGPSLQGGWGSRQKIVEYDFINDLAVEVENAVYPNVVWAVNFGSFNINGENRIYSFGGWSGNPLDEIYSYHVNSGTLELIETAHLCGSRSIPLVGYDLSGKAYLFGGNSAPTLTVEVFDPVTETISYLGNILPEEILGDDSFAWTASTGEIFIAKSNPNHKIYIFDPRYNTFAEASFSLPAPTDGFKLMFGAYDYATGSIYVVESKKWDGTNQFDSHIWMGTIAEPPVPDIEVSPLSHDFGNVELGTSTTLVATISNVGTGDLTVSSIALETDFPITSAPSVAIVVGPGETKDVEITYTPSSLGYNSAVLKITSDDPDEPVVEVMLSAVGITTPSPPSEQIANILSFFDTSIADTTLEGRGPGKSAKKRLKALRNMIKAAGDFIEEELLEDACQQLMDVSTRMDGQYKPPDFVKGESVEELETMVQSLLTSLGC